MEAGATLALMNSAPPSGVGFSFVGLSRLRGGSPGAGYPNTPGAADATSTEIGIESALSRCSTICWLVLVLIPAKPPR